jgi:hypothetical protein
MAAPTSFDAGQPAASAAAWQDEYTLSSLQQGAEGAASFSQYYTEEGVPYYYCAVTGRSMWASGDDWSANYDEEGHIYYYNAVTGESIWAEVESAGGTEYAVASGGAPAYASEPWAGVGSAAVGAVAAPAAQVSHGAWAHCSALHKSNSASTGYMPEPTQLMHETPSHTARAAARAGSFPSAAAASHVGRSAGYGGAHVTPASVTAAAIAFQYQQKPLQRLYEVPAGVDASRGAAAERSSREASTCVAAVPTAAASAAATKRERRRRAERAIMESRRQTHLMSHHPMGISGAGIMRPGGGGTRSSSDGSVGTGTSKKLYDAVIPSPGATSEDSSEYAALRAAGFNLPHTPNRAVAPSRPECTGADAPPMLGVVGGRAMGGHTTADLEALAAAVGGGNGDGDGEVARNFVGMTLPQRTAWLRSLLWGFGSSVASNAQVLALYLTSQSVPFLQSFLAAAKTKSEDAVRFVHTVADAAVATLSPRAELPLSARRLARGMASPPRVGWWVAAAAAARASLHGAGDDGPLTGATAAADTDCDAYMTASPADTPSKVPPGSEGGVRYGLAGTLFHESVVTELMRAPQFARAGDSPARAPSHEHTATALAADLTAHYVRQGSGASTLPGAETGVDDASDGAGDSLEAEHDSMAFVVGARGATGAPSSGLGPAMLSLHMPCWGAHSGAAVAASTPAHGLVSAPCEEMGTEPAAGSHAQGPWYHARGATAVVDSSGKGRADLAAANMPWIVSTLDQLETVGSPRGGADGDRPGVDGQAGRDREPPADLRGC